MSHTRGADGSPLADVIELHIPARRRDLTRLWTAAVGSGQCEPASEQLGWWGLPHPSGWGPSAEEPPSAKTSAVRPPLRVVRGSNG